MSDNGWLRTEVSELLRLAERLGPEAEGIDISDREYAMEDMASLRSHLSAQRRAIDIINASLAEAWHAEYPDGVYDDGANTWYVGKRKGKTVIDTEQFYRWLESKDAEELAKLVSATAIKVGGMTPLERETLLDETPTNDKLTLQSKHNR